MAYPLSPSNDLVLRVYLTQHSATYDREVPITEGTLTAFLATSNSPTATAADPTLSVSGVHMRNGYWLVTFDATILTPALLASLFSNVTPYCIITMTGNVRKYVELQYVASSPATLGEC